MARRWAGPAIRTWNALSTAPLTNETQTPAPSSTAMPRKYCPSRSSAAAATGHSFRRADGPEPPVWDIADKFGNTTLLVVNMDQGRDLPVLPPGGSY